MAKCTYIVSASVLMLGCAAIGGCHNDAKYGMDDNAPAGSMTTDSAGRTPSGSPSTARPGGTASGSSGTGGALAHPTNDAGAEGAADTTAGNDQGGNLGGDNGAVRTTPPADGNGQ